MRPHGEPGDPRRRGPGPGPTPDGAGTAAYRVPPSGAPGRHGRPGAAPPARGPGSTAGGGRPGGDQRPDTGEPTGAVERPNGSERPNGAEKPTGSAGDTSPDTLLAGAGGFASRAPKPRDTPSGSGSTTAIGSGTTGSTPASGGRHRRDGAGSGPGRDEDDAGAGAGGRRSRGGAKGKGKKKGSFWRELPLLIVVAVVLTFVIQTFLGRIYVIPSASMERTLHGCSGCANDRVAVDKLTYRFSDPAPGDVVVFRGPPTWADNDEVAGDRSDNVLVRGLQDAASLIGLAAPSEKDFVKRVIATGGQKVQCCDPQNRVLVDGKPLNEPYLFFQDGFGDKQEPFDPVTVPPGQLWVMGDNRNNSADARVHGPIGTTDVIGKARAIVLPVGRWGGVPDTDPQAAPAALGAPAPRLPLLPPPRLPALPEPPPVTPPAGDRPLAVRPGS